MLSKFLKTGFPKLIAAKGTRSRTGGVITRNPDALRNSVLNTLQAFDRDLFGGLGSSILPSPYEPIFGAVNHMEQSLPALKMDYFESPTAYTVEMEVPGLKKEDVNLKVKNGCLHITARKAGESYPPMKWGEVIFHKSERAFGKVSRSLKLADDAKASDVKVTLANGLLVVTIPKDEKMSHQEETLPIEEGHTEKEWTVKA